jgi:polysaccharide deacetylase family protein (PEP-CTERM system associated)
MKNIMTVDVEDWYQTLDLNIHPSKWNMYEDRVINNTNLILNYFSKYNIKATFFILGYIANKFPDLVKKIHSSGHEIGSHGNMHQLAYNQTRKEFIDDIKLSKDILENIIGTPVESFRASTWSIDKRNLWALEEIENAGYKYDSSIQPFKTYLSGMKNAPLNTFIPIIDNKKLKLTETPVSIFSKIKIPFSGGLYFRIIPFSINKLIINSVNKNSPAMIYLHPWEFDENQPKLKISLLTKFTHYYNLKNNLGKLDKTLNTFQFITLKEHILNLRDNIPSKNL